MNIVVVKGVLSRAPEVRELPSGDRRGQFEVTVRDPERPTASVPVAWFDPPERVLALAAGAEVVVTGEVRRRFFRAGGRTASRTEVVATAVVPVGRRARVERVVAAALDQVAVGAAP